MNHVGQLDHAKLRSVKSTSQDSPTDLKDLDVPKYFGASFLIESLHSVLMKCINFLEDYVSPAQPPRIVFTWVYKNHRETELSLRRQDYPFNSPAYETDVEPTQCGDSWIVASNASRHFWMDWLETGFLKVSRHDAAPRDQLTFWERFLAHELGPAPQPFIAFANGATFSADGSVLRSRPVAFYESIRQLMGHVNPLVGFYLEFCFTDIIH